MPTRRRWAITAMMIGLMALAAASPAPTVAQPAPITPAPGHWIGTASSGHRVYFDIDENGASALRFVVEVQADCGLIGVSTGDTPLVISNDHFDFTSDLITVSGQLTSPMTASGTYRLDNAPEECLFVPETGTWAARAPTRLMLPLIRST